MTLDLYIFLRPAERERLTELATSRLDAIRERKRIIDRAYMRMKRANAKGNESEPPG